MSSSPFPSNLIDHVADGVYISGWRASLHRQALLDANIRHILLLDGYIPALASDFETLDNALEDGELIPPEKLQRGVAFVNAQVSAGNRVLVMCSAGISRSSTFVLAYLLEHDHTLRAAFDLLKRQHPPAQPHPELWRSLIVHYDLPDDWNDVIHWAHGDPSNPNGA
jgi:protein-tyrosine phosphatase